MKPYHRRMKLLSLACLAFAMVAATACGSGQRERQASLPTTLAPRATSTVAADTPTGPPFPTILPPLPVPGWAVFHRGRDLWVGKLDGTAAWPLVEGARGSQFAGVATAPDGTRTLYFTALVEQFGQEPAIEGGTLQVRRRLLEEPGPIEAVTSFRISRRQAFDFRFHASDVSVSPDGQHLAYADETGLRLLDLSTGASKRLLGNTTCENQSAGLCSSFREPSWSPAGEWLVLTRDGIEGSVADFIRPLEPVTENTSDIGALGRMWSTDGAYLCGAEGRLQIEGWGVVKPGEMSIREDGRTILVGRHRDLDKELDRAGVGPSGRIITNCVWNNRGDVALQYCHDDRCYDQRIAVLAADGALLSETDSPLNQSGLSGWLPDGSGFIAVYGDGEGRPMSFIILLDGSVHELAVETDDVVAVLPE